MSAPWHADGFSADHERAWPGPLVAGPVYVVDDDPLSVEAITRFLRRLGLVNPLVTCVDGEDAVFRLDQLTETSLPRPALVVTDRHMPRRSGLELVAWMRGQPDLEEVPVVMLSAAADIEGIHEGYSLGILSYLVKPVAYAALGDVLRGLPLPWAIVSGSGATE